MSPFDALLSEKDLLAQVRELAETLGYRVYHTHDSRRSEPGFPDLVIAGHGRLWFVELKSQQGRVTAPQREWLGALAATGAQTRVWRPSDWAALAEELGGSAIASTLQAGPQRGIPLA